MPHNGKHKGKEDARRIFGLSFLPEQISVPRPEGFLGRLLEGIIDPQERISIPGQPDANIEFSPTLALTGLALASLGSSTAAAGGVTGIGALASRVPGLARAGRVAGVAPFRPKRLIGGTAATIAGTGALGLTGGLFGGGGNIPEPTPKDKEVTTEAVTEPGLDGRTFTPEEDAARERVRARGIDPDSGQGQVAVLLELGTSLDLGEQEAVDRGISEIRLQTLELPDGTQLFIPVGIKIRDDGTEEIIDIGGSPLTQEEIQSRLATQQAQQELARAQAFSQIASNIPALTSFLASPEGRLLLESQPPGGGIQEIIAQAIGGQGFGGIDIPQATGSVSQQALGGVSPFFNALPSFTPQTEEETFGAPPTQGIASGQLRRTVTPSPSVVRGLSETDRGLLFTALNITGESPADLALAQSKLQRRR